MEPGTYRVFVAIVGDETCDEAVRGFRLSQAVFPFAQVVGELTVSPCVDGPLLNVPSIVRGSTRDLEPTWTPPCLDGVVHSSPSAWYRIVGTGNTVTLSTCAGQGFDTLLRVYRGRCDDLVCVAGSDDACGLRSRVTFASEEGVEYLVLVRGYNEDAFGEFDLAVGDGTPALGEPDVFRNEGTWRADDLGIPSNLGGLFFSDDGRFVFVVGAADTSSSALYAVDLTRDPETGAVTDLGPAEDVRVVFESTVSGLDTGFAWGPERTLFHNYWPAHQLAQRPAGIDGKEVLFPMEPLGIPESISGVAFSPFRVDDGTQFGTLQVSVWGNGSIFDVPLRRSRPGIFEPIRAELFCRVSRGAGAFRYIPTGHHAGDILYAEWNAGALVRLSIDPATGLPIDRETSVPTLATTTPELNLFAADALGVWGLAFDPVTNDLFLTTWGRRPSDVIQRIGGFPVNESRFKRGEANGDGDVDISDPIAILGYLFLGDVAPTCLDALDADDSGDVNLTDAVRVFSFLFLGGAAPPAPGARQCGPDPTADGLECKGLAACD